MSELELRKKFELSTFKGVSKHEIQQVWWFDAQHGTNIIFDEDIKQLEPALTKNVGYIIHEEETHIILAYMIFDCEGYKHYQIIPKGMIVKREKLVPETQQAVVQRGAKSKDSSSVGQDTQQKERHNPQHGCWCDKCSGYMCSCPCHKEGGAR